MTSAFGGNIWQYWSVIIEPAIWSTLRMLLATMFFGFVLGFLMSVALVMSHPQGVSPNKRVYGIVNFIANVIRSFPIIILIVAISPLTRLIVGTTLGEQAAIVPLTIAATPFIAKIFETCYLDVNKQLVEAAKSMGASNLQIVLHVIIKEAAPSMISGMTIATISYLAATTLAGAVGAGGIGAVALNYGYQSFNDTVLYASVAIIFVMVQVIQLCGDLLYKRSTSIGSRKRDGKRKGNKHA